MGNFIFGYNFVEPSTEIPSSIDTNYLWANTKDYGHLKRHYRSLVATEVTIVCNFGSAKTILGLFLNDVNFTSVTIQGNATDVWTSPSFTQDFTISKDDRVQRYKIYCALTAFNYQYLRIKIPAQTPVDGLSIFRVGTRAFILSIIEFLQNPTWPYTYEASYPDPLRNDFLSGGFELISQGDIKKWKGSFAFDVNEKANESQIWLLESLQPTDYIIFFENDGDTSKGYLCIKISFMEIDWETYNTIVTNDYELEEVI